MDPFETARQAFMAKVSNEEKALLESSVGPGDVLADIKQLDQDHQEHSILRRVMDTMKPSIRGFEQYSQAMDVLSNAKPEVLSLLWGGARIVLRLALDFLDTYEKLVDMLGRIGRHLGTFEAYSRLYPQSERLKGSLMASYEAFLSFCLTCRGMLNEARSDRSKWYKSSSVKILAKSLWKPVKRDFESTVGKLEVALDDVKDEACLAEKEAASQDRDRAIAQDRVNEHRSLFKWLDPVQPRTNYEKAASLHEKNTGQWIFSNPAFRTWLDARSGVLWLHAKPGAGKTIMASTVITYLDNLVSGKDTIVLYYFCDYKDSKTQSARKLIETLLADLCRQNDRALAFMADLSRKYREVGSSCSFADLFEAFMKCLAIGSRTYVVVDALDECNDRVELVRLLVRAASTVPSLGLLMTSREEHDIQESMEGLPHLSLGASDMALDIETYVTSELRRLLVSKKLKLRDASLAQRIRTTLTSRADGMFQWVKCQFDVLCSCISDRKIHDCLDRVPAGLDETYIRILARLRTDHSGDIDMLRKMFLWLVHSLRPLKLIELAEAVTLDQSQDVMDFSAIATDPADILRFSGGLVTITDNGNVVGLAHFSIKEFLLSDRIQRSSVSQFYAGASELQLELTRVCLNYLMMNDFRDGQCYSMKQEVSRTSKYCFLSYAAHYWVEHYHSLPASDSDSLNQMLLKFFTAPEYAQNILAWQLIEERSNQQLSRTRYQCVTWEPKPDKLKINPAENPIFNAARYGMTGLIEAMCQMGYNVNERSSHYLQYPILIASYHRKEGPSMIKALISAGADINVCNHNGNVAQNGLLREPENWSFLQGLIRQGLKTEILYSLEKSLLGSIAEHPSDATQMAEFLLENGADIDDLHTFPDDGRRAYAYTSRAGPPTQMACFQGNLRVTRLLLHRGARKDFGSCFLGTPLHAAILGKHEEIVSLLLDLDVDVDIKGGVLGSPLQAAAWNGDQSLVDQLLRRGADVNNAGGCYGSALAAAIARSNDEVTELLLQHNADPNAGHGPYDCNSDRLRERASIELRIFSHTYQSIIYAIKKNDIELVRTLVERGADLNSLQKRCRASLRREDYRPRENAVEIHPLCYAMELGFSNIAEYLISQGANPEEGDCCAAIAAATRGNLQAFRALLYASPSVKNLNSIFIDALKVCDDEVTTQSLIDVINENGISPGVDLIEPLMIGAISENLRLKVSWLLEKGVSPSVVFDHGRYPVYVLPFAIELGHFAIARDLITSGADLNLYDIDIGTPLLVAFKIGNIDLMRELLRRGAEIDVPSCCYGSGLYGRSKHMCYKLIHNVAAAGDISAMSLLLQHRPDLMSRCDICETALWRAVKTEDVKMIRLLVHKGAKLDQCNIYGKPILRWAEENHLVRACDELRLLGAVRYQHNPGEIIEQSVRRLRQELSTKSQTDRWPEWLSSRRWIMLGRCLYLGGDKQNAIIALEQTMASRERRDFQPGDGEYLSSKVNCGICEGLEPKGRFHLCKDHDIMGVCEENCLKAHERGLQMEGKLETHEYLMYPRSWFSSAIPMNQVALSEGRYIPREDWLESLEDWTVLKKPVASLPYRQG